MTTDDWESLIEIAHRLREEAQEAEWAGMDATQLWRQYADIKQRIGNGETVEVPF
jgi:hypothetical protein